MDVEVHGFLLPETVVRSLDVHRRGAHSVDVLPISLQGGVQRRCPPVVARSSRSGAFRAPRCRRDDIRVFTNDHSRQTCVT
jgi:hypothetical protein